MHAFGVAQIMKFHRAMQISGLPPAGTAVIRPVCFSLYGIRQISRDPYSLLVDCSNSYEARRFGSFKPDLRSYIVKYSLSLWRSMK